MFRTPCRGERHAIAATQLGRLDPFEMPHTLPLAAHLLAADGPDHLYRMVAGEPYLPPIAKAQPVNLRRGDDIHARDTMPVEM
jgi:hypothetical protein